MKLQHFSLAVTLTFAAGVLVHVPAAQADPSCEVQQDGVLLNSGGVTVMAENPLCGQMPAARAARLDNRPAPDSVVTDVFTLNSLPDSPYTLFLDFDGDQLTGTGWNDLAGNAVIDAPPWISSTPTVSQAQAVFDIWSEVAADYRPYNINVTTQDPGPDKIRRDSARDDEYGVRVLITPTTAAKFAPDMSWAFGLGFYDTFTHADTSFPLSYRDAVVLPPPFASNPVSNKSLGQVVSHEAGHMFALAHHGQHGHEYYDPDSAWGPIMGGPSGRDTTYMTWSNGTYSNRPGAPQDDHAILSSRLGVRSLDPEGAAPRVNASTIEAFLGDGDTDTWNLGGARTVVLDAATSSNLHATATWLDSNRTPVATPLTLACPCRQVTLMAPADATFLALAPAPITDTHGYSNLVGVNGSYTMTGLFHIVKKGVRVLFQDQVPVSVNVRDLIAAGTAGMMALEFEVTRGNFPNGITLSPEGVLEGVPSMGTGERKSGNVTVQITCLENGERRTAKVRWMSQARADHLGTASRYQLLSTP